ncbi:MAG: cytochrome b N-terminal domain-containing protein [Deinococcus sp.]|nr:cytochrome b N-terminal domain-containing protein [Deinococcus sp.]
MAQQTTKVTLADRIMLMLTGTIDMKEARALLRDEPPTAKPNPRIRIRVDSFWFHLRPAQITAGSLRPTYTFGLGGLSVLFFIIETITGLILMIPYAPSTEQAYENILTINSRIPFGELMRDIHRLGAHAMVLVVFLHMSRVFITGSYKEGRGANWQIGVILLLVTTFLSFSGYLLPWDQLAFWAITIGTSLGGALPVFADEALLLLRGAPDIGQAGLLRFYLLHVFFLPLLAIIFISVHYYKVVRQRLTLPVYNSGSVSRGDD